MRQALCLAPTSFYFLAWAVTQSKLVGARFSKIKLIITLIDTYPALSLTGNIEYLRVGNITGKPSLDDGTHEFFD